MELKTATDSQFQAKLDEQKDLQRKIIKRIVLIIVYVLLALWAIFTFVPLLWMLSSSFKDSSAITSVPPELIPKNPTLDAYKRIFKVGGLGRWFLNSTIIAAVSTVINVFFASLAGYAFSKLRFPGRNAIFWVLLASIMIPGQVTLIPLYILVVDTFQMENTYAGIIVPGMVSVGSIFLMRQFMTSLPSSLIDAGRIDACSEFGIFWKIILPISKPGLAVLGIFTFVAHWNNFFWPFLVTNTNSMRTLQVGLTSFRFENLQDYGAMMAGAVCSAVPMIIVFLALQKYFLQGITIGAVKG
ncbi:carbohydrate ABC transporter permease [Lederbergia wuyishanensis]|uniref:Multiple sugar transport system permease protein n=1 Tax=Lederbergia wuyishanensis TaxID=1347903 RepID=A0ABU0D3P6_9BACI|nr:carbohydrate ABC transporter permease [Lederbergia wuyishanensis]MCJ8007813.1 carbohydrate ABC transporter permease [Lederbergia wuyishanensis]MDQ0343022.1 multiple sugar transport system permease protein [Lederbergia wuyishanensis]